MPSLAIWQRLEDVATLRRPHAYDAILGTRFKQARRGVTPAPELAPTARPGRASLVDSRRRSAAAASPLFPGYSMTLGARLAQLCPKASPRRSALDVWSPCLSRS